MEVLRIRDGKVLALNGFSPSPASKAWPDQDGVKRTEEMEDGEVCCKKKTL